MTLEEFFQETAGMPRGTEIKLLTPWGEIEDCVLVTIEDLADGDPVREDFPPNSILLGADADYAV